MKPKIFNTILDVVSEVCDVPAQDIISFKKDEEIAEARIILVWLCVRSGLKPKEIGKFLNRKNPNFVSEQKAKYTVRDAEYTCFRSLVRKAARILPTRFKAMEEAEEASDMAKYIPSCSPTDSPTPTTTA
jgi:hypothetical protein